MRKDERPSKIEAFGEAIFDTFAKGTLVILGLGLVAFIANHW